MVTDEFPAQTLDDVFRSAAQAFPNAMLVVASAQRGGAFRLAELNDRAARLAAGLRERGIGRGDVVALQLPGWAEWVIAAAAIARLGATILPIVSIYGASELGFILRQSRAKAVVTPNRWRKIDCVANVRSAGALPDLATHIIVGDHIPDGAISWDAMLKSQAIDDRVTGDPDDLAMIVYTSGTSGTPKGVCHSSRSLLSEILSIVRADPSGVPASFLSVWPPGHVAGITPILALLSTGRKLVLMDQWDADIAAQLIERERVSAATFAPLHLAGLLEAAERDGRDLSSLRDCSVGAAPVAPELIARCEARGLLMYRRYGATEHPSITSGRPGDPLAKRLSTEGRLLDGNQIRLVDDDGNDVAPGCAGEIASRGPERCLGYLDGELDAAAFLPGGWYRTGDVGRFDADGYLMLTDRKKDIIIRGGENIASREVEQILSTHPAVAEAAVVAAPDIRLGEIGRAYVVLRPGAALTLEDVQRHFADAGVARQKTPEQLVCLPDLPRNASGKVLKQVLRDAARADARIAVSG